MRRLGAQLLETLEGEQDRWFLWLPVLFGLGIGLYFALPAEPSLIRAIAAVIVALVLWIVWRDGMTALLAGAALVAIALGFLAAKVRSDLVAAPFLAASTGPVEVRGWVELVEPRAVGGVRATLAVSDIERLPAHARPGRVRIRIGQQTSALQPGDAIKVRVVLSPPAGPALPGGYDFARSAWFQGIGGVGYALAPPEADPDAGQPPAMIAVRAAIERLRQRIGARVTAALPGETGAIANALITGERGGISEATNQAFRDSGLLHVLSISGLHMAIMAGAVFLSVRCLLALIPSLALRFPIKKWAAGAATVGALGYLLISGASFPTVRSWIMISIMFLAVMLERPALALRNVALAALIILVLFPESLVDVSFQMSFAAVVALISAYETLSERSHERSAGRRRLWLVVLLFFGGIVLSTLVASLAVAPFAAYHFHKSQQYAVLANLMAIPICNVVVMPAALAALIALPLGLEWLPLQAMGAGIEGMVWCARKVAALPGAVAAIPAIPTAAFLSMLCGGLWLALWRTRWRLLGLIPVAMGLALAPIRSAPDVLVGRDGSLVAVRGDSGKLSALIGKSGMFELGRWLEHDGDYRAPHLVASGEAFRCEGAGCTVSVRGRLVKVARQPAALEDCARAAVIVSPLSASPACGSGEALVIAREHLEAAGTHAVYLKDHSIEVKTAGSGRGVRPWTAAPFLSRGTHQPAQAEVSSARRNRAHGGQHATRAYGVHKASRPNLADDEP